MDANIFADSLETILRGSAMTNVRAFSTTITERGSVSRSTSAFQTSPFIPDASCLAKLRRVTDPRSDAGGFAAALSGLASIGVN